MNFAFFVIIVVIIVVTYCQTCVMYRFVPNYGQAKRNKKVAEPEVIHN